LAFQPDGSSRGGSPNRRRIFAAPSYLKPRGRPQVPNHLMHHDCLILRQHETAYGLWCFTNGRQSQTVKVRGTMSSNDGEVVLNWALDGHGILMRAECDAARFLRSGRLKVVLDDFELPPADIYAIYSHKHNLAAKVRVFVEFPIESLQAAAPRGMVSERW
jgi:LysR family transcriptional regulator, transcriptional activator for dmlA